MEKQVYETQGYRHPVYGYHWYKEFYTDGTSKIYQPYEALLHPDYMTKSKAELQRSGPRTRYIGISDNGYVWGSYKSKSEAKKYAKDERFSIKAIDNTGKVVELSDEDAKFIYPKLYMKEIKMSKPKYINNAKLTKMSRRY